MLKNYERIDRTKLVVITHMRQIRHQRNVALEKDLLLHETNFKILYIAGSYQHEKLLTFRRLLIPP